MSTPIRGKVTNIIDEYTLVISVGHSDGVKEGMRFDVGSQEIAIVEPDTKEELGKVSYVKARVQVTKVYDRFSLARSYESVIETSLPFPSFVSSRTITKELPIDYSAKEKVEKEIKIGDKVIQTIKEPSQ